MRGMGEEACRRPDMERGYSRNAAELGQAKKSGHNRVERVQFGTGISSARLLLRPPIEFSELVQTGSTHSSGFFLKKKPPFTAPKKSTCIPKML
jgi:hypothetical protein